MPTAPPERPARVFDLRRPQAVYFAPDGTEWPLSAPERGWSTIDDVSGLGAAPVDLVTDPHPRGGVRVRHVQPQARVVTWPLLVWGDSHLAFLDRWRSLARAFTMTRRRGPGRLRVLRPDGSARDLSVWYSAGFDGEPGHGFTDDVAAISLLAEDPYWRSTETLSQRYTLAAPRTFLSPYPSLSSGRVFGEATVDNPGDVEAWPEWVITGPATGITATNNATGEAFTLTYTLTAGQRITITTDPPTVRGPAGQNLSGALSWPGAVLWGLDPGRSDVTFAVAGATGGASVELRYKLRFETA
ncbi:phage distal tail protein [Micromonospora arida]|uniref:phage distal tail protein n=1 Tax=Micromonospora arida TaxID=2203715 RepID=UPI003CE8D7DC